MRFWLFIIIIIAASKVFAYEDARIRDSNRCSRYFNYFEKIHNIPSNLLGAVSVTESGVWHEKLKRPIPWPWAINVGGKGYYYDSKQEAVDAVKKLLKQGHKSIDVGCMQINLHYHPKAFANLEQAFEPRNNINYAASFLRNNFDRHANWHKAVAAYHSETTSLGRPYAQKVMAQWRNIEYSPVNASLAMATTPKKYSSNGRRFTRQPHMKATKHSSSYKRYAHGNKIPNNRRKSNMFIKVRNSHNGNHTAAKLNTVENITREALDHQPAS